jgi:hypothetical protein
MEPREVIVWAVRREHAIERRGSQRRVDQGECARRRLTRRELELRELKEAEQVTSTRTSRGAQRQVRSPVTRNHLVLVVTPYWSDGKRELALMRGVGRLVSIAAPDAEVEAADTLEGPWDEAVMDLDGSLALLAGDRLLRVSYGTSSIDAAQAVRLVRPAVERLARAR